MSRFKKVELNGQVLWYDPEWLEEYGHSGLAYDSQIENGELKKPLPCVNNEYSYAHIVDEVIWRNNEIIGKFSDLVHKDV